MAKDIKQKYKPDPLFADLKEELKDPANYKEVAEKIIIPQFSSQPYLW